MNPTDTQALNRRVEELLSRMTLKEKVALLSGLDNWRTVPLPRLGIRSIVMSDGPHGVRTEARSPYRPIGPATAFPTGVAMAASWDPALIERVGEALAEETLGLGCQVLLGPCVNIVRTPVAGRNFESYAEDPYLAGRIGVAWVKGLQRKGVGASLKHYACNNQEYERFRGSSEVDARTLREIYLAQFEQVVKEADPWTVMCAYNRVNGTHASQHTHLLREILKEEWGYEGAVISDWNANHTVFESVAGGLDLEMPGPAKYYGPLLEEAVQMWQIAPEFVDDAARRMLRLIGRAGGLDEEIEGAGGAVNTPEHQALARELAEASLTLLKNERALLPLGELSSIAVIGPNAQALAYGGGSSAVEPPYSVGPLEGLRAALGDEVEIGYEEGADNWSDPPLLPPEWARSAEGEGEGFLTEYFNGTTLEGEPVATRVYPQIAFWSIYLPEGVNEEAFAIRYRATLTVPESGQYRLRLINSGLARVILDGELLLENDTTALTEVHMPYEAAGDIFLALEGGRSYDLQVEYVKPAMVDARALYLHLAPAPQPEEDDRLERAVALAKRSEVALVFVGMPSFFESEGHDRPHMRLPGRQEALVRAVAAANPRTVVVVNAGSPVEMDWIEEVPAVLFVYYPGMEGGNAIARVLTGAVNPSGRLPVTLPVRYEDNPTYGNYPGNREVRYGEGLLVGYRYYDAKQVAPLFPFGHGLSYTTFDYGAFEAPEQVALDALEEQPVEVALTLTNSGERPGAEVVQLYVHDVESTLMRPPQELKGFAKVYLEPGETQRVTFALDRRAFAFYHPHERRWVVEPGDFEIRLGASSRDIRARATVTVDLEHLRKEDAV